MRYLLKPITIISSTSKVYMQVLIGVTYGDPAYRRLLERLILEGMGFVL